jgi:hypothetical protein
MSFEFDYLNAPTRGSNDVNSLPEYKSAKILEIFLENASAETVFEYFREYGDYGGDLFQNSPFPKELQEKLLERNNPIINLALASYSDDDDILRTLFLKKDEATTIALCSNKISRKKFSFNDKPEWITEEELLDLCENDSIETKIEYFTNPNIRPSELGNALEREDIYATLSDEKYYEVAICCLSNPFLHKKVETEKYASDGWDEYTNGRPLKAAWGLLLSLPNDVTNAYQLNRGLSKVAEFDLPHDISSIEGVVDLVLLDENPAMPSNENDTDGDNEESEVDFFESPEDFSKKITHNKLKFLDHVFKRWSGTSSTDPFAITEDGEENISLGILRTAVAAQAAADLYYDTTDFLSKNEDSYVRQGFYQKFNCNTSKRGFEDYRGYLEKDKKDFIEQFIVNPGAYSIYNTDIRNDFNQIVFEQLDDYCFEFEDRQSIKRRYDLYQQNFFELDAEKYPIYKYWDIELNENSETHQDTYTLKDISQKIISLDDSIKTISQFLTSTPNESIKEINESVSRRDFSFSRWTFWISLMILLILIWRGF